MCKGFERDIREAKQGQILMNTNNLIPSSLRTDGLDCIQSIVRPLASFLCTVLEIK